MVIDAVKRRLADRWLRQARIGSGSTLIPVDRRTLLGTGAILTQLPFQASALIRPRSGAVRNRLWYQQPAARWEEALPLGNGRLGAMVYGRTAQERIQLNEDSLWAGSQYVPDNPEAYGALTEVRRLIGAGKFKEAEELASAKMMARPLSQMSYGTLGDLLLNFTSDLAPTSYQRTLDLETATSTTHYAHGRIRIGREAFASAPDQVVAMRLAGPRPSIDFDLAYRAPGAARHAAPNYTGPASEPAKSPVDWALREDAKSNDTTRITRLSSDTLLITGRNESTADVPSGLTYAIAVKVTGDGSVEIYEEGLRLRNASHATLLIAAATSYVNFRDVTGDPVARVRKQIEAASAKSYTRLKRDHVQAHRALFDRMSLDLGWTPEAEKPTDERILAAEQGKDPALAALYLQYGRYLLISSSRPGSQPANLQGIWNDGTNPPWGSKYTININTEMNYWPADPANIGVCVEPLLRMVEDLAVTGARTAKTMYRARGWVAHHNTDLWRATAPIDGPQWGLWPLGGAWLCTTLWDHWDYSRSDAFLKRLYPLMRGASLFFLDTLIDDPKGRGLITSPSVSPENQHPFGTAVCAGPAMDRQILRDLFDRTIRAARRLGRDPELVTQLAAARAKLAPDQIGKLGQLQEWLEDWDAEAPEQQHRHVSHLYAVYPSDQLNVRDTPDFIRAAEVSLDRRGDRSTGWATAWRLCLWARMGRSERAHAILLGLLGPERTYPNMFDSHPPFQIDGNFGGTAGILEMLVQSWGGEILLLPALPSAWRNGSIRGARARGGMVLDIDWHEAAVSKLLIKGPPNAPIRLRMPDRMVVDCLDSSGMFRLPA